MHAAHSDCVEELLTMRVKLDVSLEFNVGLERVLGLYEILCKLIQNRDEMLLSVRFHHFTLSFGKIA